MDRLGAAVWCRQYLARRHPLLGHHAERLADRLLYWRVDAALAIKVQEIGRLQSWLCNYAWILTAMGPVCCVDQKRMAEVDVPRGPSGERYLRGFRGPQLLGYSKKRPLHNSSIIHVSHKRHGFGNILTQPRNDQISVYVKQKRVAMGTHVKRL